MKKLIIVPALVFITSSANTQLPVTPPEADPFIPKGYEALDYKAGDLNGDKQNDAILILKQPNEDSFELDEATPRPLIILIRQADGKLKQILRNDKAIMCRHCGGVFGDPYQGTEIFDKSFSISFYGGSSWRWGYNYEFAWHPAKKNWYLVKESQSSFQAGDPETTMKNTEIDETKLGQVSLDKFNSGPSYDNSKWKVKSIKTYFYDNPKLGSNPRKGYLLKNNVADGIRELTNFIEVNYTDTKGNVTTGFILRKDLERL